MTLERRRLSQIRVQRLGMSRRRCGLNKPLQIPGLLIEAVSKHPEPAIAIPCQMTALPENLVPLRHQFMHPEIGSRPRTDDSHRAGPLRVGDGELLSDGPAHRRADNVGGLMPQLV